MSNGSLETSTSKPLSPQSSVLSPSFLCGCAAWLVVRLVYNGLRELVPDEAYYWVWSRHLARGYLDHPPMVAWVIWCGTHLFGTNEFGVRSGAAVLTLGTILLTIWIARQLFAEQRVAVWTGWILLLSPLGAVMGTIITPDAPTLFFSVGALGAAVAACRSHPRSGWIAAGICLGLALLSKYTAILLTPAIGLAVISTADGRRQLKTIWPWLGIGLAGVVFWPDVEWNRVHHWASFQFQWVHGTNPDKSFPGINLLEYMAGQFVVYTPILFVAGLAATWGWWRGWWRGSRGLGTAERMVLMCATVPLVFFAVSSFRHKTEANWPVFAYFPMTIILAKWAAEGAGEMGISRADWVTKGVALGLAGAVVLHVPEMIRLVPVRWMEKIPSRWEEAFGWKDFGKEMDALNAAGELYCTSYEYASEASFYMRGNPQVWLIATDRPTAYDYFPGRPLPASLGRVVCVTRAGSAAEADLTDIPDEIKSFSHVEARFWNTTALGRVVRRRRLIIATQGSPK